MFRTAADGPGVDGPAVDGPGVDGPAVDGPGVDGPAVDVIPFLSYSLTAATYLGGHQFREILLRVHAATTSLRPLENHLQSTTLH
jgi:hypothetical protein